VLPRDSVVSITRLSLIAPGYPAGSREEAYSRIQLSGNEHISAEIAISMIALCGKASGTIVGVIHGAYRDMPARCARDNSARIFKEYTSRRLIAGSRTRQL